MPERVRFAPSPTGRLHVGNARTALMNRLFAMKTGATLLLRIEDTDRERSRREHEEGLVEALRWLGILWDEGPDVGGPHGPYRQSERAEVYREYAEGLRAAGLAYECFCTEEELEAGRIRAASEGRTPRYSGRCRNLTERERAALRREGRRPCLRFRVPQGEAVAFTDAVHGPMRFETEAFSDFVILRADAMPSYNFAAAVDDHLMGVTTVIRGEDHLPNTPRQILLYRALGWEPPRFAHHGLLLGPDRTKLGKRHGATSVEAFRDMGILPQALANYLALVGTEGAHPAEVMGLEELAAGFSLERSGKSAAVFDPEKLRWLNRRHMARLSPEALLSAMTPYLSAAGCEPEGRDPAWLREAARLLAENVETLAEVAGLCPMLFDEVPPLEGAAPELLGAPETRAVLSALLARFPEDRPETWETDLAALAREIRKELGISGKTFYTALRLALTGVPHGPELARIVPLLSPATIRARINAALKAADNP